MKWNYLIGSKKDGIVKDGLARKISLIQNSVFKYQDGIGIVTLTEPVVDTVEVIDLCSCPALFLTLGHSHWAQEENRGSQTGPVRRHWVFGLVTVVQDEPALLLALESVLLFLLVRSISKRNTNFIWLNFKLP